MPGTSSADKLAKRQQTVAKATIADILEETQGHLILRLDAWRSTRHFSEVSLSALYCLIALFFLVYFATESFLIDQTWHGQMLLVFAVLTVCCFVFLRVTNNKKATDTFIVTLLGGLCLFLLYTGGISGTGPIWYFVFPLVALFIQRLWAGIISVAVLFIITLIILSFQPAGFDPAMYTQAFIERLLAVYLTVSMMAFFYAYARTSAELHMDNVNRSYKNMANTDDLTKLANRRRMTDVLYQEVSRSQRNQRTFTIIVFDIDYFKKINDQYGHDAGDVILRAVPDIVRTVLRTPDICARWGGEEFLVLLPETDMTGAKRVAERLRVAFENHRVQYSDLELAVTISLGVSEFSTTKNLDACLKQADKNLYAAKAAGRNCVVADSVIVGERSEALAARFEK